MKRIVLCCSIIAASFSMAFAQNQQTPAQAKAAFEAKVTELNTALTHNNPDLGKTIVADLNQKMIKELGVTKTMIANAPNQAAKDAGMLKIRSQQTSYSHVMNLSNDNITGHAAEIHTELENFGATY